MLCSIFLVGDTNCINIQNFELKQLKKGGTWTQTVNTKEINWYPMQKVNIARRKLEGANPADITWYFIILPALITNFHELYELS